MRRALLWDEYASGPDGALEAPVPSLLGVPVPASGCRPSGRPDAADSRARTREFLRLILDGRGFDEAALAARVKPIRALAILSQPEVRRLIALDQELAA